MGLALLSLLLLIEVSLGIAMVVLATRKVPLIQGLSNSARP